MYSMLKSLRWIQVKVLIFTDFPHGIYTTDKKVDLDTQRQTNDKGILWGHNTIPRRLYYFVPAVCCSVFHAGEEWAFLLFESFAAYTQPNPILKVSDSLGYLNAKTESTEISLTFSNNTAEAGACVNIRTEPMMSAKERHKVWFYNRVCFIL